jgi:uncharacterized peroxidase-related enzyme
MKESAMPDTHVAQADLAWVRPETPRPLAADVAALFAATEVKLGYVRNQQRVLAGRPAILAALGALSAAINQDPAGALSVRERELIALVVSAENRCEPCVFGHASALRAATGDAVKVATIEVNYRRAGLDARERALADYALKVTRAPAEIEPADLDLLRAAGLSEDAIIEAAAVAAYFNLSNRLNSALGIHANPQAYLAHR